MEHKLIADQEDQLKLHKLYRKFLNVWRGMYFKYFETVSYPFIQNYIYVTKYVGEEYCYLGDNRITVILIYFMN
jgi:hypothetical protein